MAMRLAKLDSIAIDSETNDIVVILKTEDEGAPLPIWVGNVEALSIAFALAKVKPQRPITHDLLVSILMGFEAKVLRVVVSALVENTYYALIYLQLGDELVVVDSRPSDAIAIAVRTGAAILIQDEVPTLSPDENEPDRKKFERRLKKIDPKQLIGA
jgi:uncharacterized protein